MLLARLLDRIIHTGSLTLIDPGGKSHHFGDATPGSGVIIRLTEQKLPMKLFLNAPLYLGEAYMDGSLRIEQGSIYDFLDLVSRNLGTSEPLPIDKVSRPIRHLRRLFHQYNPISRSRQNVAHHYDLSGALYDLFLDEDHQYSCAYFTSNHNDLDKAQRDKKRHLAAKLRLDRPGLSVLDIGSGWGGMGLYIASAADCKVTGVTLSQEQHTVSSRRAREAGLSDRVNFQVTDYREVRGKFDRIVSVGMFEHVGTPHYQAFFQRIADLLTDDGVAVLHSIGRMDGPGDTNAWIRKYIFPGGYAPALSETVSAIEKAGLWVNDVEILRLHYAETLRLWRERFLARRDEALKLYDERFCRMWEFYLAASETTFRSRGHMVFQIQISRSVDALPLTRDYMVDEERRLAAMEQSHTTQGSRTASGRSQYSNAAARAS